MLMLNLDMKWRDEPRCGLRWLAVAGTRKGGLVLFEPRRNSFQRRTVHRNFQDPPISRAIANYLSRPKSNIVLDRALNPPEFCVRLAQPRTKRGTAASAQPSDRDFRCLAGFAALLTTPAPSHLSPHLQSPPGSEPLTLFSIFIFVDAIAKCARCVKWGPDVP
jgi:hypothetical protein